MTRCQKLAVLNLAFFALIAAVLVLAQLDMLDDTLGVMLFVLVGLAGLTGAVVVIAKTSWKKGTVEDERDRLYGNRSFIAAYFAFLFCILAGPFAAVLGFRGESIPLGFLFKWVGGSWAVSMLVQSMATLVQYRRGS
jgi:hypothetical protein